ncbi:MAG: class I SAM-dependent methyltransferase [Myxococcales bacterium]|nr:class I SAM-dependent methyltransferase [Myxococcales bacterium]
MSPRDHIPPLRFAALTPIYDRVVAATLPERRLRSLLVRQVGLRPGERVVDLGCGTGAVALQLAERTRGAEVVGLDPDAAALAIARRKLEAAGLPVELHRSTPWDAPFAPGSFDRVVSCLVMHHLRSDDKRRALRCAREWLRVGGEIHLADWGAASGPLSRLAFLPVQLLDGFETTTENVRRGLAPALRDAGFTDVAETHREHTALGTLSLYRGRVAAA